MPKKKIAFVPWRPQGAASPYDILQQARTDAAAGRYDLALKKHDWFHRNAVDYERTPHGPRLTSALADWVKLAQIYPPAMAHLRAVRDEADKKARASGHSTEAFMEFEAINRYLGEYKPTVKTFLWLDRNRKLIAKRSFDVAMAALVEAGEYKICGKYLNGGAAMARSFRLFRYFHKMPETRAYAEEQFSWEAAAIVALLVINGRERQARTLAKLAAERHWKSARMKAYMDRALKGKFPKGE